MTSKDKITFTSNVNVDNGYTNNSIGTFEQTMELFINEDTTNIFIEWDIPEAEETVLIGIWIDNDDNLIDYDGVFELPKQAIELLRKNNIKVSEEYESND